MNTYCDDCKRCTGGCMVKSEVEGDDYNRCSECEAKLQDKLAALAECGEDVGVNNFDPLFSNA